MDSRDRLNPQRPTDTPSDDYSLDRPPVAAAAASAAAAAAVDISTSAPDDGGSVPSKRQRLADLGQHANSRATAVSSPVHRPPPRQSQNFRQQVLPFQGVSAQHQNQQEQHSRPSSEGRRGAAVAAVAAAAAAAAAAIDDPLLNDDRANSSGNAGADSDPAQYNEALFNKPVPPAPAVTDGEQSADEEDNDDEDFAQARDRRLLGELDSFCAYMFPRGENTAWSSQATHDEVMADALQVTGLTNDALSDWKSAESALQVLFTHATNLFSSLESAGLFSRPAVGMRVRRCLSKFAALRSFVMALTAVRLVGQPPAGPAAREDHAQFRFAGREIEEEFTAYQNVLIYLLDKGMEAGYRRYRGKMMLPIRTADGIPTGAWAAHMTIEEFVMTITRDKILPGGGTMWCYLTKDKSNTSAAITYLSSSSDDQEIPWLKPDRHIFSFANGMYLAKDEEFVPYSQFQTRFPLGPPVSCKYHNLDVDPRAFTEPDWYNLPTPTISLLLDTQHLSQTVQRWFYILSGRCLYNVGELDDWQVAPYFKGLANTGKSKILMLLADMYEEDDVGTISNKIEPQFGLGDLSDKLLLIADDVRSNIQLDQSDFQNMVSGNRVSCAVKHQKVKSVTRWHPPMVLNGNEVPGFQDNAGSYGRRVVLFLFSLLPQHPDPTIAYQLSREVAMFIVKCNRAYRNALRRYKNAGIWEILPAEFREQRDDLTANTNALANFLASDKLVYGAQLAIPIEDFKALLFAHARASGFAVPKLTKDYYLGPFTAKGLSVKKSRRSYPPNAAVPLGPDGRRPPQRNRTFVFGCDLASNYADAAADGQQQQPQPLQQQQQRQQRGPAAAAAAAGDGLPPAIPMDLSS